MVTGPRNIEELMISLRPNESAKHFLLGNNIIGPVGAQAIASFIRDHPDRFETWYLAGNCIDSTSLASLVDTMVTSPGITNVWLKRIPLGPSAATDIYRLTTQTPALRTLDLDQTELGDDGVAELFHLLTDHSPCHTLHLRTIYLNACGIGRSACFEIARFFQASHCTLESIYLSNNPIGSAVSLLADGLAHNHTVQRLALQSCGLKDEGMNSLLQALEGNSTLTSLDLGQAYATEDLGMRYNWLESALPFVRLIQKTRLQYLNLGCTPMTKADVCSILTAIGASDTMLWFFAKPFAVGGKMNEETKARREYARVLLVAWDRLRNNVKAKFDLDYEEFERREKRFLISPRDVRLIDSVYRNRDAAAARRGIKGLEKWWKDGDQTLAKVADGSLK